MQAYHFFRATVLHINKREIKSLAVKVKDNLYSARYIGYISEIYVNCEENTKVCLCFYLEVYESKLSH